MVPFRQPVSLRDAGTRLCEEAVFGGLGDGLQLRARPGLLQDPPDVGLRGLAGHPEPLGDVLHGQPLAEQGQHLQLVSAPSRPRRRSAGCTAGHRRIAVGVVGGGALRGIDDDALALHDAVDGGDEVVHRESLGDEAGRTGGQCLPSVLAAVTQPSTATRTARLWVAATAVTPSRHRSSSATSGRTSSAASTACAPVRG